MEYALLVMGIVGTAVLIAVIILILIEKYRTKKDDGQKH